MSKLDRRKFYIDGAWVDPLEPSNYEVFNPATEESVATISLGSAEDINMAVKEYKQNKRYIHIRIKVPNIPSHQIFNRNSWQTGQLFVLMSEF